jgi:hypothetical protein
MRVVGRLADECEFLLALPSSAHADVGRSASDRGEWYAHANGLRLPAWAQGLLVCRERTAGPERTRGELRLGTTGGLSVGV